jgi:fumarate hydratase class II
VFADKCIRGIEADEERCYRYAASSPAIATALNPLIGYEAAARVVKQAQKEGRTIRDIVVDEGLVSAAEADKVLDLMAMTKGGVAR